MINNFNIILFIFSLITPPSNFDFNISVENVIDYQYSSNFTIIENAYYHKIDDKYKNYNINYLNLTLLKNKTYIPDVYDCDDFAFDFMHYHKSKYRDMAIGYIRFCNKTTCHIMNLFAYNNEFYVIEPQTGEINKLYNENNTINTNIYKQNVLNIYLYGI